MKSFSQYITEELPTREVKASEFPNPLSKGLKAIFQHKGDMDGDSGDDIVKTKAKTWSATKLKPSQSAIYLGKSLGMAVCGVKGGDLGSIVSKDTLCEPLFFFPTSSHRHFLHAISLKIILSVFFLKTPCFGQSSLTVQLKSLILSSNLNCG